MGNQLVKPTIALEEAFNDYINEWKEYGEKLVPTVLRRPGDNFEVFIEKLLLAERGIGIPEGWVANSTYLLVNDNQRILGACHIRHELTETLLNIGGHVGYGVRPTERGKGYASEILRLALLKVKNMGVEQALITCNENNIASKKVILNNGGVEGQSFVEEDGNVVKRYWIEL
ncbi:GNAT family N-acetyltransferase [Tenuibacillus multivorans]|uniref:Predicted acetyltransferase n=1 Tax=Tenuibacillus multivorans TaxID=237069 RepID=A0A1H0B5S5_9BACI|nr:GNAT family N-acetyltransferase [Tenuibacillus multivorans]GEL78636.1 acetyltransferase [Tenuibacillus multivorans]SDN40922.1 Predicted acetyltransferase [Tenuibacillus multivorans]